MKTETFSSWCEHYPQICLFDLQKLWQHRGEIENITCALELLSQGEPLEYILNQTSFGPFDLHIQKPLLIPRDNTWQWLEKFIAFLKEEQFIVNSFIELGTGSGAISKALKQTFTQSHITGLDINPLALEVTAKNLGDVQNIKLLESHWWTNVSNESSYDLIISNPPYCSLEESLWLQGTDSEDPKALYSPFGGLKDIYDIIKEAQNFLSPGGKCVLEHGAGQGRSVVQIAQYFGLKHWKKFFDSNGFWRATCLWL